MGKIAFSLLPLSPESVERRKTILKEIVKDEIWTLDQVQGIINVNVPVRCTIVRLKNGELWVHNPVGPTAEMISMVKDIQKKTNCKVKYIVLATLGVEHKGTTGAFARNFPNAMIFIQPGQYSFPINLPSALFFKPFTKISVIPENFKDSPWAEDIEHIVLDPLVPKGVGGFSETAFFHKKSKTLIVTDLVVKVEDEPPAIIQEDPRALLYHARDNMFETIDDTPQNRRKGWRRMVLFGLTFQPSGIKITETLEAIKMLKDVPRSMKVLGEGAIPYDGGLYPWKWIKSEIPSFNALKGGLFVAPILQKLILNREPEKVLAFVEKICEWKFTRVIPCHLSNDIRAEPKEFRSAFNFLEVKKTPSLFSLFNSYVAPQALEIDCALLTEASDNLTKQGVLFPIAPLVFKK